MLGTDRQRIRTLLQMRTYFQDFQDREFEDVCTPLKRFRIVMKARYKTLKAAFQSIDVNSNGDIALIELDTSVELTFPECWPGLA